MTGHSADTVPLGSRLECMATDVTGSTLSDAQACEPHAAGFPDWAQGRLAPSRPSEPVAILVRGSRVRSVKDGGRSRRPRPEVVEAAVATAAWRRRKPAPGLIL